MAALSILPVPTRLDVEEAGLVGEQMLRRCTGKIYLESTYADLTSESAKIHGPRMFLPISA